MGIEDVDRHNAEAGVRIFDHRIAVALGIPVSQVRMMPRSEWLDWVALFRVAKQKGWSWLQ